MGNFRGIPKGNKDPRGRFNVALTIINGIHAKWKGETMRTKNLQGILNELKIMAECELTVAKFYATCAEIWSEDKEFWWSMERQENQHAKIINMLAEAILKNSEDFELPRTFNPAAVRTMITGIENNIRRVKSGEIQKNNALFIARDIEQSLIEAKFGDKVKTDRYEYQGLITDIVAQTMVHKDVIEKKIDEMRYTTIRLTRIMS